MPEAVRAVDLVRMFRGAIAQVRKSHEELSHLDSCGGDGDHGTTMLRAMAAAEKVIEAQEPRPPGTALHDIGWAILGIDGGATGPLFGSFFQGMAEAAGDRADLDPPALATAFGAGLESVGKRTRARPGDKTLVDALAPAVDAARRAASSGADIAEVLRQAAEAAARGAESTAAMAARFGRAKNVGAKSVGAPDPGATSVSLMFRGFFEGYESHG